MPERLDTGALPVTEPHPSPIFDTGPHPDPLMALGGVGVLDDPSQSFDAELSAARPLPEPVAGAVVPGPYPRLKWWRFVLVLAGVWVVAAALGLALYYRWFHAVDKTWPDFLVLV